MKIKTIMIIFVLCGIFLVGCQETATETYPLKQINNTSKVLSHGQFLGSSSSTLEILIKFIYIKNGAANFGIVNSKYCQIYEDVNSITESYVTMTLTSSAPFSSVERVFKIHKNSGVILSFHIPKNSIENFILIDSRN